MHPVLFHLPGLDFPVFSYGVMLGLSFVVGWYVTLGLAERDGLPKEMLATCFVVTAISALVFSRLLFVVTNPDSFHGIGDVFAVRSGGMVAYGGFLGGFIGSVGYLRWKGYPLLPWADVAVPALAAGLFVTRIGCYLNGCDFGKPLGPDAPGWLAKAGTFPQWDKAMGAGDGSPAYVQHFNAHMLAPDATTSLAVHPTQLYESFVGLSLVVLLLLARRRQRFRGQIFLTFAFAYGVARFLLEIWRDDLERGDLATGLPPHVLFPLCYAIFGGAFAIGFAHLAPKGIVRRVLQALAFVPAIYAYVTMRPGAFVMAEAPGHLSTSQFIGLLSAAAAGLGFMVLYRAALLHPEAAMALPQWDDPSDHEDEDEDEDEIKKRSDKTASRKTSAKKIEKPTSKASPDETDAKDEDAKDEDAKAKASTDRADESTRPTKAKVETKKKLKNASKDDAATSKKASKDDAATSKETSKDESNETSATEDEA